MATLLAFMARLGWPQVNPPKPRSSVVLGARIRTCPGGRHAWFESSVGHVRKPVEG